MSKVKDINKNPLDAAEIADEVVTVADLSAPSNMTVRISRGMRCLVQDYCERTGIPQGRLFTMAVDKFIRENPNPFK